MKRLIAILALSTAFGVAACDAPDAYDSAPAEAPAEAEVAPAAEEAEVPVAEPNTTYSPPADSTTMPAQKRSSEESVRPESETLFY